MRPSHGCEHYHHIQGHTVRQQPGGATQARGGCHMSRVPCHVSRVTCPRRWYAPPRRHKGLIWVAARQHTRHCTHRLRDRGSGSVAASSAPTRGNCPVCSQGRWEWGEGAEGVTPKSESLIITRKGYKAGGWPFKSTTQYAGCKTITDAHTLPAALLRRAAPTDPRPLLPRRCKSGGCVRGACTEEAIGGGTAPDMAEALQRCPSCPRPPSSHVPTPSQHQPYA